MMVLMGLLDGAFRQNWKYDIVSRLKKRPTSVTASQPPTNTIHHRHLHGVHGGESL